MMKVEKKCFFCEIANQIQMRIVRLWRKNFNRRSFNVALNFPPINKIELYSFASSTSCGFVIVARSDCQLTFFLVFCFAFAVLCLHRALGVQDVLDVQAGHLCHVACRQHRVVYRDRAFAPCLVIDFYRVAISPVALYQILCVRASVFGPSCALLAPGPLIGDALSWTFLRSSTLCLYGVSLWSGFAIDVCEDLKSFDLKFCSNKLKDFVSPWRLVRWSILTILLLCFLTLYDRRCRWSFAIRILTEHRNIQFCYGSNNGN